MPPRPATQADAILAEALVRHGLVTREQLAECLSSDPGRSLPEVLVARGYVDRTEIETVRVLGVEDSAGGGSASPRGGRWRVRLAIVGSALVATILLLATDRVRSAGRSGAELRADGPPPPVVVWRRLSREEGWGFDPLERLEGALDTIPERGLTLIPRASSWANGCRGELVYREVGGDFDAAVRVRATSRSSDGPPGSPFSFAGLLARAPTGSGGSEDDVAVVLGVGAATNRMPRVAWHETRRGRFRAQETPVEGLEAHLRIVRLGAHLALLFRAPGEDWTFLDRSDRPELPDLLQLGLTAYADAGACRADPGTYFRQGPGAGSPDLVARFDEVRIDASPFPGASDLDDEELLRFLDRR